MSAGSPAADPPLARQLLEMRDPLARQLLEMRDPLARIRLAASQLARLPAAAEGGRDASAVGRILDSVTDLDQRLEEALRSIAPPRQSAGEPADCGAVLARVVRELAPVLGARGRTLEPSEPPSAAARGDAHLVRRAALQLLRACGAWAGPGGRLRAELVPEGHRCGVRVTARRGASAPARWEEPFGAVRHFSRVEGIALDLRLGVPEDGAAGATLWLPAECAP